MTRRTRIILCDDHPIVLAGLQNLIALEPDFEIVGQATRGLDALTMTRDANPDLAIVDISMPQINGIALTKRLAEECPSVRIVLLTLHEDRAFVRQALDAGAAGYVLKRSAAENLIPAIRAVLAGGFYLDPAVAGRVFDTAPRRSGTTDISVMGPQLTAREAEVLKLSAAGYTNKEIARKIDLGVKTVDTHRTRGLEKIGQKTRADLVRYAVLQGWLTDV